MHKHQGLVTPLAGACHDQRLMTTILAVDGLLLRNRRISTLEIVVELSISKRAVQTIIHKNLADGEFRAMWVPKHLPDSQKTAKMGACLTVSSKISRALAIIIPIFLCFDCQFSSSHAYYKQHKP